MKTKSTPYRIFGGQFPQVTFQHGDRLLIGEVVSKEGDRLTVRHFCGDPWPVQPLEKDVTFLARIVPADEEPKPIFVGIRKTVMQGEKCVGVMCSKTMAKRTANALNRHKPNREGV